MKNYCILLGLLYFFILLNSSILAQDKKFSGDDLLNIFKNPPESAKPWVFWYWMQGAVSREGITADLEAMKEAGIGGAYLVPIREAANPPIYNPPVNQLTPEWFEMVNHAMKEANRLNIKIAMHASDGFATAGGPWITPELSMQKIVWKELLINGGKQFHDTLPTPESYKGYYRDIAILAFPAKAGTEFSTRTVMPKITTSIPGVDAQFLVKEKNKETFRCDTPCWIQYAFDKPFTCRTVITRSAVNNIQPHRLKIEVSNDGQHFEPVGQLEPPRHGWMDTDIEITHSITPVTARFFRFIYNKEGAEPGAEDMEAAKWNPNLKLRGLELLSKPAIHQFEGKTGLVWRISKRTTDNNVPDSLCIPKDQILDITKYLNNNGVLAWNVPAGHWIILRIGYTSTGHKNNTAGAGIGLECDKLNPAAVTLQFDKWFGEIVNKIGLELTSQVLKTFHVDSWECGSQNWSPVFRDEFLKRRSYDLLPYLPTMAGIPVQSADVSEQFLYDVRQTIMELVNDNFYGIFAKLAKEKGCTFTGECTAPVMTGDGMLHYKTVDIPMGEFWVNSPTHDKLNDMLDAISGAHIYGKNIVQAEAFTTLRMDWSEHPGMLKALGDRNFALGANRFVFHVFTHNPWMDKRPGMTLGPIGLYFQRDQTWWKASRAWMEYTQRCQALLQVGSPVADIAIFTGEEIPRRAVLPEKLINVLPGFIGSDRVNKEIQRLKNAGIPMYQKPDGVTCSANITDPAHWVDPLKGYSYDSFNPDALHHARVDNGRIILPGGASYKLLVLPGPFSLNPDNLMTPETAKRLLTLVKEGATVIVNEKPSISSRIINDSTLFNTISELWSNENLNIDSKDDEDFVSMNIGKGKVIKGPYIPKTFSPIEIEKDIIFRDSADKYAENIAWAHRSAPGIDIYFISNQMNWERFIDVSLHTFGQIPELWDPVTGNTQLANNWSSNNGRTQLPVRLEANGSVFIIFRQPTNETKSNKGSNWPDVKTIQTLDGPWQVTFDPKMGGPKQPVIFSKLTDWSTHPDSCIRFYSGTAVYTKSININIRDSKDKHIWLDLGRIANIAKVKVNGISCGTAWTPPYSVDITKALKPGNNLLTIEVTNTWTNRLIGDQTLPENKRITWTTAPFRLKGKPLLEAGLCGPVKILEK
jgi:hypothetical protein